MKLLFCLALFLSPKILLASDSVVVTHADYDFDTYIKATVSAQIVENPEILLTNKISSFVQSLKYTASKKTLLNKKFNHSQEADTFATDQLCTELHDVTLIPIRELGAKGNENFDVKMKPSMITISGREDSEKPKAFKKTFICK
jgi:hypothetical protein